MTTPHGPRSLTSACSLARRHTSPVPRPRMQIRAERDRRYATPRPAYASVCSVALAHRGHPFPVETRRRRRPTMKQQLLLPALAITTLIALALTVAVSYA